MPNRNHGARLKAALDLSVTCAIGVAAVMLIWRSWTEPGGASELPRRAAPTFENISSARLITSISDAPSVGSASAPLVLIEYSDFECPFCARHAKETFGVINDEFVAKGQVQYVFRNYPLENIHHSALKAAKAAACAKDQGKFMPMREFLFSNQKSLAQMDWTRTASDLQLDGSFGTCVMDAHATRIQEEVREGARLGVTSTPTFFLGTRLADGRIKLVKRLNGAVPYATFKETLEKSG